ncbi:MAG: hypothetical protein KIT27_00425 [Legionellales bacterium]|nr:hypothetical protein [Legionellales bacterium]
MAVKMTNSLFFRDKSIPDMGNGSEISPANKDIAWFSSVARNGDLSRCELETVLKDLNDFCEEMEGKKAEIDAELQLLEAYKALLEERQNRLVDSIKLKR